LPPEEEGGLFSQIFTTDQLLAATADRAWLQAMLDVEAALAVAEAEVGVIPAEAAPAIVAECRADLYDASLLGRAGRLGGNPVIPLVQALTARVNGESADWVHWGATSQDILDSAAMLVIKRSLDLILSDLAGAADACATLAERHRSTLMAGRTLLQQALPITFGLKSAGWLAAILDARTGLQHIFDHGLAVQLGGAAGTLASLGSSGPEVTTRMATQLDLHSPALPWHTHRGRMAAVATGLGIAAGVAGKIALDVALLMQTEVGEAFEPAGADVGGSSTLPHKRNPVAAASIEAAVHRVHALVPVILQAMIQPHERAVGGWQSEWQTMTDVLQLAGGAIARVRQVVDGLEVDVSRMGANLHLSGDLLMGERIVFYLAPQIGRSEAKRLVSEASRRASASGESLRETLAAAPPLAQLSAEELDQLFDPRQYVGSTNIFIDRALESYRDTRGLPPAIE
jgi:3-carboxy-cis,cis-muconate cycloisomerase